MTENPKHNRHSLRSPGANLDVWGIVRHFGTLLHSAVDVQMQNLQF